jgi:uncharacterized protein YbjQ (UPF0145 family)
MGDNDDSDLTRIEDLQEFEHTEDESIDDLLEDSSTSTIDNETENEDEDDSQTDQFSLDDPDETQPDMEIEDSVGSGDSADFLDEEDSEEMVSFEDQAEEQVGDLAEDLAEDQVVDFGGPLEDDQEPELGVGQVEGQSQTVGYEEAPVVFEAPEVQQESFGDVKKFAENMTYGNLSQGGNPPFSIILKNVKYTEDQKDILNILDEHGLLEGNNKSIFEKGLENGAILIGQLSEYSAIFLSHKLRRFDISILVGLSEEIHPSKHYVGNPTGPISKHAPTQNKAIHHERTEELIDINNIILSTTPQLENYNIERYLGVISENLFLNEEQLINQETDFDDSEEFEIFFGDQELFKNLQNKIKQKALELGGNAVVGLNYQFTPFNNATHNTQYKLTCTGSVVWTNGN